MPFQVQLHRLIDKTSGDMDLTFIAQYTPRHGFKVMASSSN